MNNNSYYAKFRKGLKDPNSVQAYIISTKRENVENWQSALGGDKGAEHSTPKSIENFSHLTDDFVEHLEGFYRVGPFIMGVTPLLVNGEIERRIYDPVVKQGKKLECEDGYEFYEFGPDNDLLEKLIRDADDVGYLLSGIASVRPMLLLGLISTYDAFLAKLLKVLFIAKPEIISASDRSLTLKEITTLGSIEASRDYIIEKEIETILRMSHQKQIEWLEARLGLTLTKDLDITQISSNFASGEIFSHTPAALFRRST